jgi:heptosyltransferase III
MKAGVFCHNGLGDGVNCLVLSNHLHLNGWEVDTYQNTIGSMQNWFPHLPVKSYPKMEELPRILATYEWFFIVQNDTDEFVKAIIREAKKKNPEKTKVLYLYPSPNIINEPYYLDCLTNPTQSIAENLRIICRDVLKLPKITSGNGFIPPPDLIQNKFPKRIVIHPTSARPTRNWPKERFVKLALHLRNFGFDVTFVPGEKDFPDWQNLGFKVLNFSNLDELSRYIYESRYLIGNDSGLGHLASALGISTLTICRRKAWAKMWAPSFYHNVVITPSSLIPNISGLRWRDRHWQKLISVKKVLRGFRELVLKESRVKYI